MLRKYLIRFFVIFSVTLILLFGTGLLITLIFGDDIKQYFITQLNKNLRAEIKTSKIEFSVFSKFPNANINFSDVVILSVKDFNESDFKGIETDTFLVAKKIYLEFSLIDIIKKNYKIKNIDIHKGRSWLFVDGNNNDNYHFWNSGPGDTSSFILDLRNVEFSDFTLHYYNTLHKLEASAGTPSFILSGHFKNEIYDLKTKGEIIIGKLKLDNTNYVTANRMKINLGFNVNNNKFTIKNGNAQIGKMNIGISGTYYFDDSKIDIHLKGNNLDIVSFLSLLPAGKFSNIKELSSKGVFYFESDIKGSLSSGNTPWISARFGIEDAAIRRKGSGYELKNVYAKGAFTNGEGHSASTSELVLDTVYATLGDCNFYGSYSARNFSRPYVTLDLKGDFDLAQLKDFFLPDTFGILEGKLHAGLSFAGNTASVTGFTTTDLKNSALKGDAILYGAKICPKGSGNEFGEINAGFAFYRNDVRIDSMSFTYNKHKYNMSGYLRNLISYLLNEDASLYIETRLNSGFIDLKELFAYDKSSSGYGFVLPDKARLSASIKVDKVKYGKFTATDVTGFIDIENNTLTFTSVKFNTLDGSITGEGLVKVTGKNELSLQTNASLKSIDINKLFYSFDNFGQDFIADKHLKGIINADVTVSSEWDENMALNENKLIANGSMTVSNGELINFEPLYKLSEYIALSELSQIKFAQMKNEIAIKDRKVIIPNMEIKSTAFNIEISGEHTFDHNIDYKLKVLLSEILANKAQKARKENSEFGYVEDDGLGRTSLFLSVKGTTDNYKISYDTKQVREHIKENLKQEKETLKQILHEEFGWFKNDSALLKKQKKEEEIKKPKFMIEWDDTE